MATVIGICNKALGMLGEESIASINDVDNERSIQCKLHYEATVRYLLARGRFSFALARKSLVRDGTAPDWGFLYRFRKPTDPLYLVLEEIDGYESSPFEYQPEGPYILADCETMNIRYVARIEESRFPAEFEQAVATALSARMALKFTGSKSTVEAQEGLSEKYFNLTLQIDWASRPPRQIYRQPGREAFRGAR